MRHILALAALIVPAAGHATTALPAPTGATWYDMSIYLSAASTSCSDTVGSTQGGQLFYAGAGKTGSKLFVLSPNSTGSGNPDVTALSLPVMPAASATPSNGAISGTDLQAGKSFKGTATITLTYGDANAFFGSVTTVEGSCTETNDFTAIHSGK